MWVDGQRPLDNPMQVTCRYEQGERSDGTTHTTVCIVPLLLSLLSGKGENSVIVP